MKQNRKLLRFNVHLTDHCNLNCKGCGHFSPIAKEKYLDLFEFENDCKRLSQLTNKRVERIELMGGEPLLHPYLIDIISIARRYFNGEITIATNGILLSKQDDNFWKSCHENDINIGMTSYNINVDIESIKNKAKHFDVVFSFKGKSSKTPRLWYYNPMDISGKQNIKINFDLCKWANVCIFLENGKLYTCVVPALIKHLNRHFSLDFKTSSKDYIDIYKVKDISEVFSFLNKPIPFCRYCLPQKEELTKWEISNKSISEWI